MRMWRRKRVDAEIDAEMRSHIDMRAEDNLALGMSPEQARREARLRFGNPVVMRETAAGTNVALKFERLWRELNYAVRRLKKSPGFTLTVVLTLALGIAAMTAIFSLVEGILLRPLPFHNPDQLMLLGDHLGGRDAMGVTAREIETYTKSTSAFTAMGAYIGKGYEMPGSGGNPPEEIPGTRLTAGVFPTLRVEPLLGRVFTREEEEGKRQVAVISYALWLNRFHRDAGILGRTIDLDGRAYSVIGVMPRSFEFPMQPGRLNQTELWLPLSLTPDELAEAHAGFWGYQMVARLRDGVTVRQGALDADRVSRVIARNFPPSMAAIQIRGDVAPLRESVVGDVRPLLKILLGAVGIVLLIACVNAAGLLLVRAIRRRREYALRLALGARGAAILRESIMEGMVLSIAGAVLGLALAAAVVRVALHLLPESMPRIASIAIDGTVAGFALLLAMATGAICSLAPAFAAIRTRVIDNLKESSPSATGTASHAWLRSALVVVEIATALVLLTACGAFLRSFEKMRAVDPGFRPEHVLVAGYQLPITRYPTFDSAQLFHRALVERLESKPGISKAGMTNSLPAAGFFPQAAYTIEGVPAAAWKLTFAPFATVYGDYFQAMGIPLLAGRYFAPDDRASSPLVVIVSASMAKHCWPGQSAIGKRMHVGNPRKGYPWAMVVGVVADTKLGAPDEPSGDQWFAPMEQPATLFGSDVKEALMQPAQGYIAVRAALPPDQMSRMLRAMVAEIDPLLALEDVKPMEAVMADVEAPRRFNTDLITAFAVGALLLAITGIYAVVAFSVSQRTQEIAIRMAVGAQRAEIARLVMRSGAKLALLGCGLGVLGSLAAAQVVSAFLFDVSATDPLIYAVSVAMMMMVALLASALPAIRAASADPIMALRAN